MARILPSKLVRSKSWTPLQRRAWLTEERRHQRNHLLAPLLVATFPDKLAWSWVGPNPYRWNVWESNDNGATYFLPVGYWMNGTDRAFAPDGGWQLYIVVGVDAAGNEITRRSNAVRPSDGTPNFLATENNYSLLLETGTDFLLI